MTACNGGHLTAVPMAGPRFHPRRTERAFSSANTVVWLPVIIMMSWWALENALLYRWAYRAQAAADAAALAAAARYRDGREAASDDAASAAAATDGPAGAIAIDIGDGTSGGEDLEFGTWDEDSRTFTPDAEDGGAAVRVTVRFAPGHPNGAPRMVLAGLFTPGGISITRRSTAVHVPPRHETSVLATASSGAGLELQDSATVSTEGGLSLATTSSEAAELAAGTRASVAVLRTAGSVPPGSKARVDGAIEEGTIIPQDPFRSTGMPPIALAEAQPIVLDPSGRTIVTPGVHTGLSASDGTIVLQAGLHQFAGPISLQGTAHLQLSAATVQLGPGAALQLSGSATMSGTPSASVAGWERAALISRRPNPWVMDGGAVVDVDGLCYVPESALTLGGSAVLRAGSVISRTVSLSGTASAEVDGDIEPLATDPVPGRARLVR